MINPRELAIKDFTYHLPDDRIAKYPLPKRDESKLLVYKNGRIEEDIYKNISQHIPPNSLLIFNNTKVIEARILFQKATGGVIELFCLEPYEHTDPLHAMQVTGTVKWKCMVGGAGKWKHGPLEKKVEVVINQKKQSLFFKAEVADKTTEAFIINFSWQPAHLHFSEVLHHLGVIPLPPYIKRKAEASDYERYQTVYAREEGSVAAPTAGLHFTNEVLQKLDEKNITHQFVTLHVGAGTFKPVKSETMGQHEMHAEWIEVKKETIEYILNYLPKEIIPVGTTSLRTLETLYWMGLKAYYNPGISLEEIEIKQWDAYDLSGKTIITELALQSLLTWMNERKMEQLIISTKILIVPGYTPKIADAIITNFHQPNSTLLLLVAALIGKDWKQVYDYALQNDFRFLSYGDGSLLWINK
ncbi:MAG: S-adenosylmethionine:tRNA ribosyltransferase-isomerase [Sphingobacteriales bacterium]